MTSVLELVDVGQLGPIGEVVGEGGQAEVLELKQHPDLVLKRYHEWLPVDGSAIDRLLQARARMSSADRAVLDAHACWPLARVMDGRRFVGVVLPRIGATFTASLQVGGVTVERPCELQYLLRPEHCVRLGLAHPEFGERWLLATQLARLMDVLERSSVVLGDLSEKNALWSPDRLLIFVIDCDTACIDGHRGVVHLMESPGWEDPLLDGREPGRPADRFKIGLAAYRMITLDATGLPSQDDLRVAAPALGPILSGVLSDALCGPPETRPAAAHVLAALSAGQPAAPRHQGRTTVSFIPARQAASQTMSSSGSRRPMIFVGPPNLPIPQPSDAVRRTVSQRRPRVPVRNARSRASAATAAAAAARRLPLALKVTAVLVAVLMMLLLLRGAFT